jgi:hypothetical protein
MGSNPLTGVVMTDPLPAKVSFVSAATTLGTVSNSSGTVIANIGSLNPGDMATVTILFVTASNSLNYSISNTATASCDQSEQILSNNTATDVTTVYAPVTITVPPAPQDVAVGANATFFVNILGSTTGTSFQWFFNRSNLISGAIGTSLTVSNATAAQVGNYSVTIIQQTGEDLFGTVSSDAALTVH